MNTHKESRQAWQRLALVLLALAGVVACQTPEEDPPPPQTEILSVDFIPNENLSPGDTVAIRCRIKDSLDTRFNFYWRIGVAEDLGAPIGGGNLIDAELGSFLWDRDWLSFNRNTVHWVVADCTQTYYLRVAVRVDNGDSKKATVKSGNSMQISIYQD
jgi:hypothetical protein